MNLKVKNNKLLRLKLLLVPIFVIISFSLFFYYFNKTKSSIQERNIIELKNVLCVLNNKVDSFFLDSNNFLFFLKKYLENEFELTSNNKEILRQFNIKYIKTKYNCVSNFQYVFNKRFDRKQVSASYLSKNELITDDIKYITVLTEKLDKFWKLFFEKYPFLTMTYVDRTGFYREFPFRRIKPYATSYLSDPRNYPYYVTATTIDRDEVFITNPYQNGNELYMSIVIPVYQGKSFRGVLTIDVMLKNFKKLFQDAGIDYKSGSLNIVLFGRDAKIHSFLFEEDSFNKNFPVNLANLRGILKEQKRLLSKKIKIYSILIDKNLITYIKDLLNNKDKTHGKQGYLIVNNCLISIKQIHKFNLFSMVIVPLNFHSFQNIIGNAKRGITFLVILLTILFVVFLFILKENDLEKEFVKSIIKGLKDEYLRGKLLNTVESESEKGLFESIVQEINLKIESLKNDIKLLKISIENINLGILLLNEDMSIAFINKWFRQFIVDIEDMELLPDELKSELQQFKKSNKQQFKKIIKLFERHYLIKGEKVINGNNIKENYYLFTISNAEDFNEAKKQAEELKIRIKSLEQSLANYRKSFEELNTRMIQSDKFAVFGELIQGIVHNINNPLMIVMSRLSMIKTIVDGLEDTIEKKRLAKHINNIIDSLKKINEIIDSVLIKAKMTVEKEERLINVNEMIKRELEFFNADLFFKHKVKKEVILTENLPNVRISQSDFSQVLHNLLKNALDALKSSPNPTLTIKTYTENRYVVIEIIDNGPGVPEQYKDKIFEQYFTTKGSHGTGIGLYNARKIIEEYGGELLLKDSKRGATFVIKLPFRDGE